MRMSRKVVLAKTAGHCGYCGRDLRNICWDREHIKPLIRFRNVRYSFSGSTGCKFPANHCIENILAVCRQCNKLKGAMDLETYRGCFEPGHRFYMETEETP